jgi:hypothetical protein
MYAAFAELAKVELTLYTDALIVRGTVRTRQHRVSDILNLSETPFLVLEEVTVTDLDGSAEPIEADVAQINLDAVLFAAVDTAIEPLPELRTPKMQREAVISIPPFRVFGTVHLLAGSPNLREALTDLTGRFLPVTDAEFEAPSLGRGRGQAAMVAVNHQRAQILAKFREAGDRPVERSSGADPWASAGAPATPATPAADPWAGTTFTSDDDAGSGQEREAGA